MKVAPPASSGPSGTLAPSSEVTARDHCHVSSQGVGVPRRRHSPAEPGPRGAASTFRLQSQDCSKEPSTCAGPQQAYRTWHWAAVLPPRGQATPLALGISLQAYCWAAWRGSCC